MSEVLGDAVSGYRALWRYLGSLSLALTAIVVLFSVLLVVALGEIGAYAFVVLSVVGSFWITALLVQTIDDLQEDDAEAWLGARFARFWPHVNQVSVAALALSLLLVPGWLLLATGHPILGLLFLLAGIVVSIWLVLAVPLIVIEGYGVADAFTESKELVSGSALKVFGALLALGFATGLAGNLIERVVLAVTDSWIVTMLASGIFGALVTTPLMALFLVALYEALRQPTPVAPTGATATA
jgi:hypothetical protein